ncbi:MAG: hypothetical protein KAH20_14685 [Methylococcales bacterium]|nr:hypothetical protein [Methylococcales bacterium]
MIEDRTATQQAINNFELGFDFSDVLHHASYKDCNTTASFDDKNFVRHAKRNSLMPSVIVPK